MNELLLLIRIGDRLRKIRMQQNITQADLAKLCNIEKAGLSRIESGQSNPTLRTLFKLCGALNVDMAELFTE